MERQQPSLVWPHTLVVCPWPMSLSLASTLALLAILEAWLSAY